MGVESDTTALTLHDFTPTDQTRIHVLRLSYLRDKAGSTIQQLTSITDKTVSNKLENSSCVSSLLSRAELTCCPPEAHKRGAPEHPEGPSPASVLCSELGG